jgi:26S proteasome regulatory subunit (ATPase 3-interacting protein)
MAGGVKGAKKKLLDDLGIDVDSDAQIASLQEYRKLVDGIKKKRAMEARMKKYKRNTAA